MPYKDPNSEAAKASKKRSYAKWYAKNRERVYQNWLRWCRENPERRKEQKHRDTMKNIESSVARINDWKRKVGVLGVRKSGFDYRQREKRAFIAAYGSVCACCGEDHFELLTADHINGRGSHERREFGRKTYAIARKQGYPKDKYRLLCWNCNASRGMYGYCPHEQEESNFDVRGLAC